MMFIQQAECLTALGDASETCRALLDGEIALKLGPVRQVEGEDRVPQAWMPDDRGEKTGDPRWMGHLEKLLRRLPDRDWGSLEFPIFITSSNYGIDHLFDYSQNPDTRQIQWMSPHRLVMQLQERFGWGQKVTILSHACVTGQLGMLLAERAVAQGGATEALVFSFDFLSPFVIGGFHSLKILNEGMPAPYQRAEMGSIGLGEGAGAVVVGREPSPYEIVRQSLFNEMYHFTSNAPDGSGFARIMSAITEGRSDASVWVKGHGTGTLEAGQLEAEAIEHFLPGAPLVSWKGSIGHTLGSCAVVELAIALEAVRGGRIPGNIGTSGPFFSSSVQSESFAASEYTGMVLTSNAFGGAHAAMWVRYA